MIIDSYVSYGPSSVNHDNRLIRPLDDVSTVEALLSVLDRAGIDHAIVYPPRWIGGSVGDPEYRAANASVREAADRYPKRLTAGVRVNPNYASAALELARECFASGGKGLIIDPDWDNVEPDDELRLRPLVELTQSEGRPILVETGWSPVSPGAFWRLVESFPDTPFIFGHLGGRLQDDAARLCERLENLYLETSDHMYFLGHVIEKVGAGRVIYGSNTPFASPEAELLKVTFRTDVTEDDKALVLGGNAARLYGVGTD